MNIPEIFKYNSLISVPLFSTVALLLTRKATDFSPHKHTVSMTVNLLNNRVHDIIFRLNFVIKALLDFGFALYVLKHFNISLISPSAIMLISSAFLFGLLAYFIEGKFSKLHVMIVYASGVLWFFGEMLVVKLIGSNSFFLFSFLFLLVPLILGFSSLYVKKTNLIIQSICMVIWYIWLLVFVLYYL